MTGMLKEKDERIREAQGEKSRKLAFSNRLGIYLRLYDKPLTFSELLDVTGFSKPVLTKHLKTLQAKGWIEKDTIKQAETERPEEIGKMVYRMNAELVIPSLVDSLKWYLKIPSEKWDPEIRNEVLRHYEGIAGLIVKQYKKFHTRDRELKS